MQRIRSELETLLGPWLQRRSGWRFLLLWERLLIIAGVLALVTYGAATVHSKFYQAYDHWAFSQALKGAPFSLTRFLGHVIGLTSEQNPTSEAAEPQQPVPAGSNR